MIFLWPGIDQPRNLKDCEMVALKSDAFDIFDEIFFGKSTQKRRRGSASVGIYQEGKTAMAVEGEKQTKTVMQTTYTMHVLNESMEVIN